MKKVTEQREELESVAGGLRHVLPFSAVCPNCGYDGDFEYKQDSCGFEDSKLTCPNCGFRFVEG